jgi:hypothetical protein
MNSVLKDWVLTLPFRMQSVLMSSIRGCDTARKDDVSKVLTRALRPILFNNADPSNSFMGPPIPNDGAVKQYLWDLDSYPMHFVAHLMHAAEIVGYKHPDPLLRKWWLTFYQNVIRALHVNPETEQQLDVRLGFTPDEKKINADRHQWDAGTGTSHGGRDRPWSGGS